MITLKYQKTGALTYVSHIDLLRLMERTMRRADLPVAFSKGYNPHMLMNLGVTLPLGVASLCEYVTVDVDCAAETFLERYNRSCPDGLMGLSCRRVEKNPNLAGVVCAARYRIAGDIGDKKDAVASLAARSEFVVDYPTKKDAEAKKDLAPLIYALHVDERGIDVCMAAGNVSVRPQSFVDAVAKEYGVTFAVGGVTRTHQYVRDKEGALVDVDDYLKGV